MEELMNDAGNAAPDLETALEAERLGGMLERAVSGLPGPFRVVFVMRSIEGMSVRETARVLGLNEITVKTRLFRARRMLRKRIGRYLQGAADQVYEFAGARCDALTAAVMARVRSSAFDTGSGSDE